MPYYVALMMLRYTQPLDPHSLRFIMASGAEVKRRFVLLEDERQGLQPPAQQATGWQAGCIDLPDRIWSFGNTVLLPLIDG